MTVGPRLSRRRLLRTAVLGGAAAVLGGAAAVIGARRAAAQASPEWTALVAAAKKEGKVVVNTFPGDGYARALKPFTQAYPDIKLEHTSLHSQDFAPRIVQERQGNLFTWYCGRPACGIPSARPSCCPRPRTTPAGRAASSAASRS